MARHIFLAIMHPLWLYLRFWLWISLLLPLLFAQAHQSDSLPPPPPTDAETEAFALYDEAIDWYQQARRAEQSGDTTLAMHLYQRSIETSPLLPGAYNNLAMLVFRTTRDLEQATALATQGITLAEAMNDTTNLASLHNNLGYLARESDRHGTASCLRAIASFDHALALIPDFLNALYNKASALHGLRQFQQAEALYHRVLALDPHYEGAHLDLGAIHFARGEWQQAIWHQDRILDATSSLSSQLGALNNKGHFLKEHGHWVEAMHVHERSVQLAPWNPLALANWATSRRTLCEWQDMEMIHDQLAVAIARELHERPRGVSLLPYDATLLQVSDAYRKALAIAHARAYEQQTTLELLPPRDLLLPSSSSSSSSPSPSPASRSSAVSSVITSNLPLRRRPLRIAYLSYDFREHPMGHLTLGLLDSHHTSNHNNNNDDDYHQQRHPTIEIETYCYSYGPHDGSEWRRRAEQRCGSFVDIAALSDLEASRRIALDEVDLVVDLMAHTKGARLGLTALRPSRLVVNYLGFPGTMGASFTDFALVDRWVVPPERVGTTMTERVVYLPATYQVNQYEPEIPVCSSLHEDQDEDHGDDHGDHERMVVMSPPHCHRRERLRHALPRHGVVLCNMNTIDKMEPEAFSLWMRILRRVPQSVLWLLAPTASHASRIQATLRGQARAHGVHGDRLVFAPRLGKRAHLARLTLADLFLDSIVYNAHSTAADALWANLPIVTLWGDTFPSRVAAALLQNAGYGLETLVPNSLKEYEDLAVQLALTPSLLTQLRAELARQSLASPLFDTPRTTASIETAYALMHDVALRFSAMTPPRPNHQQFHVIVYPTRANDHDTWFAPPENTARRVTKAVQLALHSQQHGQWELASHIYHRVLAVDPYHVDAIHLLGVALYQSGRHSAWALQQLHHAVSMYPEMALFRFNRALVHRARNETELARRDLVTLLQQQPTHFAAFAALTDILFTASRLHELVDVYERYGGIYLEPEEHLPLIDLDENPPATRHAREQAYLQYSYALAQTDHVQEAIAVLTAARTRHPLYFQLAYNLAALHNQLGQYAEGDEYQIVTALAEARHRYKTEGASFRKRPRPRWGQPVVVVYCHEYGQSWWDAWGPSSLQSRGLGGSEEAVVFMARELVALGYWVEVYGNPLPEDMTLAEARDKMSDDDGGYKGPIGFANHTSEITHEREGVHWYPHYAYGPADAGVDVFIAWRYHISLALAGASRATYFWVHDMPAPDVKQSRLLTDFVTAVFCVSTFQASQFPVHVQHKLVVTSNALDPAYFVDSVDDDTERNTRFVYGSAPNRGLHTLLLAWPHIRSRIPTATLQVYYGFTDAFIAWGQRHVPGFDAWKQEIERLLQQTGVTYEGLVDHDTLAHAYAKAGFYLYPTTFSETSCVSLMKAMANGAIPITTRFPHSALPETCDAFDLGPRAVQHGSVELDAEWVGLWVTSIVNAVAHPQATAAIRRRMLDFARERYRWTRVALQWQEVFTSTLQ